MEEINKNLGFIQEFHVLEITVGEAKDNFEELKKLVAELWSGDVTNDKHDKTATPETGKVEDNKAWENNLLNILYDRLDKSLNRTLSEEKRKEDIFIRIIDLEVQKGSLEILATVATTLVNGFEKYGALRQAYDYFVEDVEKLFAPIQAKKKVKIRWTNASATQKKGKPQSFFQFLSPVNLFWKISGASILFLEDSYPDHNKYKNLGAAILFTGCFAFISGFFALSYLTDQWLILIPIALLWSLTIINIDMMIVNTMVKYEKRSFYSIFSFLSRILLGVAIAFALSVPVEMTLLNDEIRDEIERYDRKNLEQEVSTALSEFDHLTNLKAQKLEKEQLFNEEMQGNPNASGRRGYGPIAKKMEGQILELTDEITKLEQKRDSTESNLRKELVENTEQNNQYGFLASYRALHRLQYASDDKSVFHITWGIRILLLLIELLPIISKLLMRRGSYDSKYELEEQKLVRLRDRVRKNIT